jgi:hypothetical protein
MKGSDEKRRQCACSVRERMIECTRVLVFPISSSMAWVGKKEGGVSLSIWTTRESGGNLQHEIIC